MQVNTSVAEAQLSRLLALAAAGEEVISAEVGRPIARLDSCALQCVDR